MRVFEHAKKQTNPWTFSLYLGFFAGVIWGGFKALFYYFTFTKVRPTWLIEFFTYKPFFNGPYGVLLGWVSFIVFSMLMTLLYTALFRKLAGPWAGFIFGISWWAIVHLLIGPLLGTIRFKMLNVNTISTDFCLFLLWGLFIGYTVAEEFNEMRHGQDHATT